MKALKMKPLFLPLYYLELHKQVKVIVFVTVVLDDDFCIKSNKKSPNFTNC